MYQYEPTNVYKDIHNTFMRKRATNHELIQPELLELKKQYQALMQHRQSLLPVTPNQAPSNKSNQDYLSKLYNKRDGALYNPNQVNPHILDQTLALNVPAGKLTFHNNNLLLQNQIQNEIQGQLKTNVSHLLSSD